MAVNFTLPSSFQSSPMEKVIERGLQQRGIKYFREVQFDGCVNPKTGMQLRYDFYIKPMHLIIEYDGKEYHADKDVKFRDSIKDQFAAKHKMKLVRVQNGIAGIDTLFEMYFKNKPINKHNKSTLVQKNKGKKTKIKDNDIKEILRRRHGGTPNKSKSQLSPAKKKDRHEIKKAIQAHKELAAKARKIIPEKLLFNVTIENKEQLLKNL